MRKHNSRLTPLIFLERTIWIVLGCLALGCTAQAASFDCAKAASKVEKIICGDAELSKLDEESNAAYKAALQDEKQADTIRQAQKRWLKVRNECADEICVRDVYLTRLFSLQEIAMIADATLFLTGHAEFPNEADKLRFMRKIAGQQEFRSPKYPPNSEFCQQFLKDFSTSNDLVQAVEPDVKTNDEQDPRLDKWHQCENSEQKAEDIPEYRYLSLLGGPPYRYYRIDIDGNAENGKEDVIYTETYKPGTHWAGTGETGYGWIDLKACIAKGGASVDAQYPPKPLPPDIYHLNTVVKYRGNYLAVDLYPIGAAYSLNVDSFDIKKNAHGYACLWHEN
jgi:uncharacterized protein YecT (DUF1311 family)